MGSIGSLPARPKTLDYMAGDEGGWWKMLRAQGRQAQLTRFPNWKPASAGPPSQRAADAAWTPPRLLQPRSGGLVLKFLFP